MGKWAGFAVAIFLLTRALIFFHYDVYITDIWLYQEAGTHFIQGNFAYCDFWFPYPPFALPFVNIPAMFSIDEDLYRVAFRFQMFIFDVITFAGVWAFLKWRTSASDDRRGMALSFYAALAPLVGHLIYDRLDIVMTAIFIWSLFFLTQGKGFGRKIAYILLVCGALIKILPLFFIPLFMILEAFTRTERWPDFRRAAIPLIWIAAPFAVIILNFNNWICDQLIPTILEQGVRGIQIESNWALPLIARRLRGDMSIDVGFVYGAFHILEEGVNPVYLLLSKYLGFAVLFGFFVFLASRFIHFGVETARLTAKDVAYLFFLPILIIIIGQRVLSPQYLIWLMPLVALQLAVARRPAVVVAGALLAFSLTFVIFDLGFFPLLEFHPGYAVALLARNTLLVLWTADLARRVLRALRISGLAAHA